MDWLTGRTRRSKDLSTNQNCKLYLRQDFVRERLIEGDLSPLVHLPYQVDYNEWLASNTLSFFEHINSISGCLTEFCKPSTGGCMTMTGPGNVQYHWLDDRGKKYKCSAAQYIDYAMSFAQKCTSDEAIFPTKYGNRFPSSFEKIVRKIHRLLLHVLAHVYHCHCREVSAMGLRSHLNTTTFHFLLFNRRFGLVENKESNVLGDLFERLQSSPRRADLPENSQNFTVLGDFESSAITSMSLKSSTKPNQNVRPLTSKENENSGYICDNMASCGLIT